MRGFWLYRGHGEVYRGEMGGDVGVGCGWVHEVECVMGGGGGVMLVSVVGGYMRWSV